MPLGLLGKKLGHTRVYDATGNVVPVTVVLAGPNRVLQVKTQAGKDGYNSVQLGFDDQKEQRLTKALLGHIKKQNGAAVKRIRDAGMTVLIVEQRMAECLDIADRAYILQTGRLQMQGTSAEIRGNPDVRKAYLGL